MSEPADPSDLPHNAESVRAENMLHGLDPTQHQAVTSKHNPLATLTGAGSDKTRVLTRRITHRVETSAIDPTRTMAATITRTTAGFSTVEVDQVELTIPANDPLARMTNGLAGLPIGDQITAMDESAYQAMVTDMMTAVEPWIIDGQP